MFHGSIILDMTEMAEDDTLNVETSAMGSGGTYLGSAREGRGEGRGAGNGSNPIECPINCRWEKPHSEKRQMC